MSEKEKLIIEDMNGNIIKIKKWTYGSEEHLGFSIALYTKKGIVRFNPGTTSSIDLIKFLTDPNTCPHRESCLGELAEDCPNFDDCGQQYIETNRG